MDLIKAGYSVQMYNFGAPRIGCNKWSEFLLKVWPEHYRVTHHKDIVPHNPSSGILMEFWHDCWERYEDANGMHECNNGCEDPKCAAQWGPLSLSIDDHLLYMGMCIGSNCPNCATKSEAPVDEALLEETTFLQ